MLMKELQAKLAEFKVVRISEENVRDVWALMKGNVHFLFSKSENRINKMSIFGIAKYDKNLMCNMYKKISYKC